MPPTPPAPPRYLNHALAVAMENLKQLRHGQSLVNVVDKRAGY